jgi:hypothetical protein
MTITENVLVVNGVDANLTVSGDWCDPFPVPTGTVTGTISSDLTGELLDGVIVVATPGIGASVTSAPTGSDGVYSVEVESTSGTGDLVVQLSSLPSYCSIYAANGDPNPWTGLTDGGFVVVDLQMVCDEPPVDGMYEFFSTWDNNSPTVGATVTYSFEIDMTTRSDGYDDLGAFDFTFTYNDAVLAPQYCVGGMFWNVVPQLGVPGEVQVSGFKTNAAVASPIPLASCTFTVDGAGTSDHTFTWSSLTALDETVLDPANIDHVVNESIAGN